MKHFYLFALLACTVVLGGVAWAQPLQDIQFPIAELGNCESKDACASYCDEPAHGQQCFEFGKKLGLISETEAKLLETLPEQRGPGGCATDQVCREYCSQEANFEECSEFGKLHGLITDQDVEKGREAVERRREIQETLSQQGGPGACASEQECKNYCEDVEHAQECVAFAEQHNLISPEDAMRIKKAGFAGGPGGCKGPEQCRAYCEEPSHQNECIDFAEKNGFMSVEDASRARKFAGKTGPGGCKGEECRTVCGKPENARMCIEHAEKEGLLPPEELQRAKKFLEVAEQGGPGGCKGPEECQAYCSQESNQEECFSFGKKQGLIRPEDEQRFQAGQKIHQVMQESGGPGGCRAEEDCRAYCVDPLHVEECIAFGATHGGVPEGEVREMLKQFQEKRFEVQGDFQGFRPPEDFRRFEEEALGRFEQFKLLEQEFRGREFGPPQGFGPAGPQPGPGKFVGPGGCTSPSECIAYCAENKSACFDFKDLGDPSRAHEGNMPPGEFRPQLQNNLILEFKE
ncbi:MAG: hypothetical protein HYT50_02370 [Candidatus Wildermuthbacteria bacterium]|nr:hypothetical protein [Candidatus Wildermuthbacteria bacterium]